jgi:hypothetical protein
MRNLSEYFVSLCYEIVASAQVRKCASAQVMLILFLIYSGASLSGQRRFPFQDFVGVNVNREDPIKYLNACGFAREFHDWVTDEGNIFAGYVHNGQRFC